jgi:hypothetical protein
MHLLIAGLLVRVQLGEQAQHEGRSPNEPVLSRLDVQFVCVRATLTVMP